MWLFQGACRPKRITHIVTVRVVGVALFEASPARARYYDPSIGRFISEGPGCNGTNWYAYCGSNPVNAVDPGGKVGALRMFWWAYG